MSKLTNSFYTFRTSFWSYPEVVFFNQKSWVKSLVGFYRSTVPFSHFFLIILLCLVLLIYGNANMLAVLGVDSDTLIEGSVMGVDSDGNTIKLNRVNPLINSNVQLEKDISELIYEPLIRVDSNGDVHSVLAEYSILEQGSSYRFKLKPGIKWHDGEPLTVNDVVKTVELLRTLDQNTETSSLYTKVANKIDIITSDTDQDVFEFMVKNGQVIPDFFEAISFKIMPAHLLTDITAENITQADPYINRTPVGTGPYKLTNATTNTVTLSKNDAYWGNAPAIKTIQFKLFGTEAEALTALGTGQIHGLANVSIANLNDMSAYSQVEVLKSTFIYNQYWALYMNMGDNGPAALKNVSVRQAISSAINKDAIIAAMSGYAEAATGPIPRTSFAYSNAEIYKYNPAKAADLLDDAGYTIGTDGIRAKGDTKLSFTITVVKNADREAVAEVIKQELAAVGIDTKIDVVDLTSAVEDHILPRMYDLMIYGVQTLIDPDRYELFDSTQASAPGLNLSCYVSSEKRTQVVNGETTKVAAVDDDLDDARRIVDETARAKKYKDFQEIIAKEVPVVFMYYPQAIYLSNKRVDGVSLTNITAIEQRFDSISYWTITAGK